MSSTVLIAYASMSGNTEDIADLLKSVLEERGLKVEMEMIDEIDAADMLKYDGVLIGCYTWGDGDLPYEAEEFYDDLEELDLNGKVVGVFGSGDMDYPKYCEAVDLFEERLKEQGAKLAVEGLKIELAPETEEQKESCAGFAKGYCEQLKVLAY